MADVARQDDMDVVFENWGNPPSTDWMLDDFSATIEFSGDPYNQKQVRYRRHFVLTRSRLTTGKDVKSREGEILSGTELMAYVDGTGLPYKLPRNARSPGSAIIDEDTTLCYNVKYLCESDKAKPVTKGTGIIEQVQVWTHITEWHIFDLSKLQSTPT